jgi:hypothetical protein
VGGLLLGRGGDLLSVLRTDCVAYKRANYRANPVADEQHPQEYRASARNEERYES